MADIHNPGGGNAQVEDIDGQPSIGYWTNDQSWVGWQFKIDRPGQFDVLATIATPAGKSTFELAVGDQKVAAVVTSTGSYQTFEIIKCGRPLEIGQEGDYELSVKPVRGQWQPINLRSVVLEPVR